jgi:HD-like signal output (HDOD) protein
LTATPDKFLMPITPVQLDNPVTNKSAVPSGVDLRERSLHALRQLPPFSPVLTRVMADLAKEDVSFNSLAELIEKDPVLTGQVLRVVNSAAFGMSGRVSTVRQAMTILGLRRLRNIATTMSVSRLWTPKQTAPGWVQKQFNIHSVAVGLMADALAVALQAEGAESAFTAGLFLDLGLLLLASGAPAQFMALQDEKIISGDSWLACGNRILRLAHPDISAVALVEWKLPSSVTSAVQASASATSEDFFSRPPGKAPALASILSLSSFAVEMLGIPITREVLPMQSEDAVESFFADVLGAKGPRALSDFRKEFEAIKAFF